MRKILFYSKFCQPCNNFITILQETTIFNIFEYVCVDRDPRTRNRDPLVKEFQIKRVPSIFIDNQVYVGVDAFEWLAHILQNGQINSKNSRVDNLHSSKSIVDSESIFKDNLTADEYHVINDNSSSKIKTPEAEDIIDKDGNVVYSSDGSFRKKKKMNKDSLKRQQLDNEYNKMLRERNLK